MHVTAEIAQFVVDTGFDDLPPEAVVAAKNAFLDTLGVALAGTGEVAAGTVRRLVTELGGAAKSSQVGSALMTSSPNAALVNGVTAHALDLDDDIGVGFGHPSAVIVPTVLALGEALDRTGRDLIEAYVLGVEVWFRVARAMPRLHPLGWHPTGIFGALGAAAAAAKLLRLDADKTTQALGLGGSQAAGLIQNLGTMTKPFHAGNAARSGIVSAMLAADGFTASQEVLEGDLGFSFALCGPGEVDPTRMVVKLGAPFAVVEPGINVKTYPCYYSAHKCIDAIFHMLEAHEIQADDVASVDCHVPARVIKILFHTQPSTGLAAKFSMQFFMAAALVERKLGLSQFTDSKVSDLRIRALMECVTMTAHGNGSKDDIPFDFPDVVTVTLKNGARYSHSVSTAKGHADNPLSEAQLLGKFQECARLGLPEGDVERLGGIIARLDKLEKLSGLMSILRRASAP